MQSKALRTTDPQPPPQNPRPPWSNRALWLEITGMVSEWAQDNWPEWEAESSRVTDEPQLLLEEIVSLNPDQAVQLLRNQHPELDLSDPYRLDPRSLTMAVLDLAGSLGQPQPD